MRRLDSALARALVGALCFAAACSPGPSPGEEPAELETVDVEMGEESEFDLSTDRRAAPRLEGGGELPGDFPSTLPVYKPSTISDIGRTAEGGYVQLRSRDPESRVKGWYPSALERAGWSAETAPGGVLFATRNGARVRISIEQPGPVSVIRIEY